MHMLTVIQSITTGRTIYCCIYCGCAALASACTVVFHLCVVVLCKTKTKKWVWVVGSQTHRKQVSDGLFLPTALVLMLHAAYHHHEPCLSDLWYPKIKPN